MAEIFLARQHGSEGFQKLVILKRILTAFYADDQFRNMLVDEAHISMGLSHNNIAQIFDVGKADGRFFLVLELVDGWDLGRMLQRGEKGGMPLPTGLGVHVLAEVCRALSYAHARCDDEGRPMGIVHRDVSPHNILVSEQGEVKIIDFGIAKAMTKRDRTGAGIVKGKISFMSPEQAHGRPIDARSDLYAVGIMLYLVAAGRRPFEGPTDIEVLLRVQSGQYAPPEQVNPRLSPALVRVIKKAMNVDSGRRYQSADELLVDLEALLRAEWAQAGQTQLKLWLAQLAQKDGELPISRIQPTRFARPGSESVEGKSFELGDDDVALGDLEPMEAAVGDDTLRAMPMPTRMTMGGGRASGARARATSDLSLPLSAAGLPRPSVRHGADLSLAIGDDDGPPRTRLGRKSRGGALGAVIVFGVLGGGGVAAWRLMPRETAVPATPAVSAPPAAAATSPPPAQEAAEPAPPATAAVAPAIVPELAADAGPATEPSPTESAAAKERDPDDDSAGDSRRTSRSRTPAVDPYARARSYQKPEEPIAPGIELPANPAPP